MATQGGSMTDVVGVKLDQLIESHDDIVTRIDDIDEQLLNPSTGLYTRIRDSSSKLDTVSERLVEVTESVAELVEVCKQSEERASRMERWAEDHERRDAELRANVSGLAESMKPLSLDLTLRQQRRKWVDKLMWIVIAAVVAAMIPAMKYVLFDGPAAAARADRRMEQLLMRERNNNHAGE